MTTKLSGEAEREAWAVGVASEARGERKSPADAERRARFEESNPEVVRDEAWLWAGLGALGEPRPSSNELSDAALMDRVLAEARRHAGDAKEGPKPGDAETSARSARVIALGRPKTRRGIAAAFGAFALAAALAALAAEMLSSGSIEPGGGGRDHGSPAAAPSEGGGVIGGQGKASEPPPQAEASGDPPPTVESNNNTDGLKAPNAASAIEADPEKAAAPAEVKAREARHETADSLLSIAQAKLGEGKTQEAVAAYKELLSSYPSSAEARAALISLGRLSLGGGGAAEALGYFDRYLAGPGGSLSVEARYGRIQALRRLGRGGDEAAAIQDFLARHGESVYAPRLRERLGTLSAGAPEGPAAGPPPKQ